MRDVILHAFNWTYQEIADRARDIAGYGYGAVLFAPPLYTDENGPSWWQRYQPKDYRVIRSFLGRKADLVRAIESLHYEGVRAYCDIVFNHMANEKTQRDDPYNFPGNKELTRYLNDPYAFDSDRLYGDLSVGLFSPWDFNPQGDIQNWNNLEESQERWLNGLPDLDLNDWVVGQQQICLRALNELGFDGYRIDAVKHLPEDHIKRVFETNDMQGKYLFGESLTSDDGQEKIFLWPLVDSTNISFYDFPLHETLRRVFAPAGSMRELVDPAAYGQALNNFRATTFAVTHDIPNNDGFRWQLLNERDEFLANAYIICRDGGLPLIFSDHNESAQIYKKDQGRWEEAWRRHEITALIRFHNAVHGTPMRPLYEADGFLVFARGDCGIVAINKTEEQQNPSIWTYGLCHGRYQCLLHDSEMRFGGDTFELSIPPRQAQAWLFQGV